MKICFIDKTEFSYSFKDINNEILRGAETIVINLSQALCKLGHQIVVFNNCKEEYISNNYSWLNLEKIKNYNYKFDIVISNNNTQLLDLIYCKKKFVISHSLQNIEKYIRKNKFISYLKNRPIYLLLGKYHKSNMSKFFSLFGTRIIKYGIDSSFENVLLNNNINHNLSIFTSRQDRNLEILINVWINKVFKKKKDANLYITPKKENLTRYNIFNRKLSGRKKYIDDIVKSRLMLIPGHKAELYCLAASEASELCVPIITMGIGALSERVIHGETGLISKNEDDFGKHIIELYNNSTLWNQIRQNLIKKRGQNSWDKASQFFLETILKN